jgi:hypothetical protein
MLLMSNFNVKKKPQIISGASHYLRLDVASKDCESTYVFRSNFSGGMKVS